MFLFLNIHFVTDGILVSYLVPQSTLFTIAAEISRLKTALVASEHQLHLTRHDIRKTVMLFLKLFLSQFLSRHIWTNC